MCRKTVWARKCFVVDIGERLKVIRNKESRESFALKIGIHPQSLYRYEQGARSVDSSLVAAICDTCDISLEWLIFGRGPMRRDEAAPVAHVCAPQHEANADLVMIPRVAARLCAETGSLETDDNIIGMYAFRSDWICKKGNTKRMVLMDVTGDSMAPAIVHGDIVLIDQSKTDIYGHGYYAVGIDDVIFLKEVLIEPGILIFRSINKNYEDIRIHRYVEKTENVRIIGRILWVARELG